MYVCEIREGQRVEVVFDASLSGRLKKNKNLSLSFSPRNAYTHKHTCDHPHTLHSHNLALQHRHRLLAATPLTM